MSSHAKERASADSRRDGNPWHDDNPMEITVSRLTPALGAIVEGVPLAEELPSQAIQHLSDLLVEHQILFFRASPLTPHQQCRFAARFGELHVHPIYPVLPELPEIMVIDTHTDFPPDNDNWHTDVTFSPTTPLAGILAAKQLPSVGGDTLWSSNLAAYEALSPPLQRMLEGLTAEHSVVKSFPSGRWGADPAFKERYERAVAKHPPVVHPVVRTHPVSGRKSLFVNEGFTIRILGLPDDEGRALLAFLTAHANRPDFQTRFVWKAGSVALWDNRYTQHQAIWDYYPQTRSGFRVTIKGERPV